MKEKIYFIPGLMTNERLWNRILPKIEDDFEIVHLKIPKSTNFDEINKLLNTGYIGCKIDKDEAIHYDITINLTKNTLLGFYK